jgi:riboflavin kinase/FMN adenylyltransferase
VEVHAADMEIIVGIENISRPLDNTALTIGNFDGVHLGHQALFEKVKDQAGKCKGASAVMTFQPHPLQVLTPKNELSFITTPERKLDLIASCGIDITIVVPFTQDFARISAKDFVKDLLVDKIGIKAVIVGYDYRFGLNREGDTDYLKKLGEEWGFEVEVVSGIQMNGSVVSSTVIRNLIQEGEIRRANKFLGRPYEISGTVVRGRERGGRLLGFPTANVLMSSQVSPQLGVYVVQARVGETWYGGAANLGYNPTFGDTDLSLEVHIFDFDENIYEKPITVRFLDRLRSEKRFAGPQELTVQIHKDVEAAKRFLARQ